MAKDRYEQLIKPHLKDIPEMYDTMTEEQIANALGVSRSSFERYKRIHPELVEALHSARQRLVKELKVTLKMKAMGFRYTESKTTERSTGGEVLSSVTETYERYAQPDLGSIHLLLKNLDPTWHNDDVQILEIKKKQIEVMEKKASENDWMVENGE